ncbi:MAG: AzlC family ABC transporter permease [Spirochaetales bacterium]|nr:AzlC family ABC transporter permease [Spirochaetales bacterium]
MIKSPACPALSRAFKASVPVLLGYVTIGFGFGLLAVNKGYPAWLALFMSVFVFAGAAQYIGISLFAAGASIAEIVLVTLVANIRHAAYGLSLISSFGAHPKIKPYLVFALTDETYALLSSSKPEERADGGFLLTVSALNQFYWVAGTALGALAGSLIPGRIQGLDFALNALFIVLAVEQALRLKKAKPFVIAGLSVFFAYRLMEGSGAIALGLIIATASLAFYESIERRKTKGENSA